MEEITGRMWDEVVCLMMICLAASHPIPYAKFMAVLDTGQLPKECNWTELQASRPSPLGKSLDILY